MAVNRCHHKTVDLRTMNTPALYIPYSDDIETVPPDEDRQIAEIVKTIQELQQQKFRTQGRMLRDVHVKAHGCAEAEFQVLDGLPAELAQGLFTQPAIYPATVRFSNASSVAQADGLPDGRGFAIQVRGISGEFLPGQERAQTQDFLMANHPVFIASDAADYLRLQQLRQTIGQGVTAIPRLLSGVTFNPFRWPWREFASVANVATQFPRHPAGYTYYSMTPFRYCKYVVKYRVQPHDSSATGWLPEAAWQPDAMRQALERTLARQALQFDFQVQLRTSTTTMPIEDATREWPEAESPYRTVARIRIPPQEIIARHPDRGESLSFNVWHSLAAHRPLGGINRSRLAAYRASAVARRQRTDEKHL